MIDPTKDEKPPPGRPQLAREQGVHDWVYEHLAPYYNESMLARKMYVIATYCYRHQRRTGVWPTRTELGHATKRVVGSREELDAMLRLLDSTFHAVYVFEVPNPRGPRTKHYGLNHLLFRAFNAPKNIEGRRINE
jgi:hypothetical protein